MIKFSQKCLVNKNNKRNKIRENKLLYFSSLARATSVHQNKINNKWKQSSHCVYFSPQWPCNRWHCWRTMSHRGTWGDRVAGSTQELLLPLLLLSSETFILFLFSSDVFKIFHHSDPRAVEERKISDRTSWEGNECDNKKMKNLYDSKTTGKFSESNVLMLCRLIRIQTKKKKRSGSESWNRSGLALVQR